jgi:hypothetical protein
LRESFLAGLLGGLRESWIDENLMQNLKSPQIDVSFRELDRKHKL